MTVPYYYDIVKSQPQAAYAVFTYVPMNRCTLSLAQTSSATTRGSNQEQIFASVDRETRYHQPREGFTHPTSATWRPWNTEPNRIANKKFKASTEVTAP